MTSVEPSSFESICNTTRRIPFSDTDAEQMRVHLQIAHRHGLDLSIEDASDLAEMLHEGILMPQSRDLQTDFVFVNIDAGRGFFGGQKTQVLTFTSDIYRINICRDRCYEVSYTRWLGSTTSTEQLGYSRVRHFENIRLELERRKSGAPFAACGVYRTRAVVCRVALRGSNLHF